MNWVLWIYVITALASSLAAVLAWASKLWWAKEYSAAKDETIKAKDAQTEVLKNEIQSLRELTPMKLREYFMSVKEQLEEYNDKLQGELNTAQEEVKKKDSEIRHLIESNQGLLPGGPAPLDSRAAVITEARLRELTESKRQLQAEAESLKQKLQKEEEVRQSFEKFLSALRT